MYSQHDGILYWKCLHHYQLISCSNHLAQKQLNVILSFLSKQATFTISAKETERLSLTQYLSCPRWYSCLDYIYQSTLKVHQLFNTQEFPTLKSMKEAPLIFQCTEKESFFRMQSNIDHIKRQVQRQVRVSTHLYKLYRVEIRTTNQSYWSKSCRNNFEQKDLINSSISSPQIESTI